MEENNLEIKDNLCVNCKHFSNVGGPYCEKDGTAEILPPFKNFDCFEKKEII